MVENLKSMKYLLYSNLMERWTLVVVNDYLPLLLLWVGVLILEEAVANNFLHIKVGMDKTNSPV